jgi:hypothetical protein
MCGAHAALSATMPGMDARVRKSITTFLYHFIIWAGALACVLVWLKIEPKDLWGGAFAYIPNGTSRDLAGLGDFAIYYRSGVIRLQLLQITANACYLQRASES